MNLKSKLKKISYKIKYGDKLELKSLDLEKNTLLKIVGNGKIKAGENLRLRSNTSIVSAGGTVEIGNHCFFNRNCNLVSRESIKIEDEVSFGPNVCIFDHDHKFDSEKVDATAYKTGEVVIGKGCWIGAGAIILRNTNIGEGSVIGAGTIVKGDIPPHSIVTMERTLKITPITKKDNKTED